MRPATEGERAPSHAWPQQEGEAAPHACASGFLVFILADMMVFGLFFVSFMVERSSNVALFQQSRDLLDVNAGGINTLILLTSSWLVVLAVQAVKDGRRRPLCWLLALAAASGGAFVVLKVLEYANKLTHGISMLSNDFFMFYFIFTGIHMLHVVGGVVMLLVFWIKARGGAFDDGHPGVLETGGLFWHMVDLLWIVLFPLLYLMR